MGHQSKLFKFKYTFFILIQFLFNRNCMAIGETGSTLPSQGQSPATSQLSGGLPTAQGTPNSAPMTGRYVNAASYKVKAMDLPQIKTYLQTCYAKAMQGSNGQSGGSQTTSAEFEENKNKCIMEVFSQMPPMQARTMASQLGISDPEIQDNVRFVSSPAYRFLQDYLVRRLHMALYGTEDIEATATKKIVDHKTFYDLFKTQLGKNIVSTMSGFCVNANENGLISADAEARSQQRKINIDKLSQAAQSSNPSDASKKMATSNATQGGQGMMSPGMRNEGFVHFTQCIPMINHICGRSRYIYRDQSGQQAVLDYSTDDILLGSGPTQPVASPTPTAVGTPQAESANPDVQYTRNQACIIMRELKQLRKQLISLDKIDKEFDQRTSDRDIKNGMVLYRDKKFYGQDVGSGESSIDDLTSLTSNEFSNKSKAGAKLREQALIFERDCYKMQSPQCMKYMNNNTDYANFIKLKDEYLARTVVMKGKIRSMNDIELRQFLLDEGRTTYEVDQIIQQSKAKAELLQERVAFMYEKERQAIIQAMSKKLQDSNLQMGHTKPYMAAGTNIPASQQETKELREKTAMRLHNQETEVRDTLMFNNMVSGYLSVIDGQGVQTNNSKAAYRELNDSYYNPTNQMTARFQTAVPGMGTSMVQPIPTVDPIFFQKLQATTRQNLPMKSNSRQADSTLIQVPTLNNNILGNYSDKNAEMQKQMENLNRQKMMQDRTMKQMNESTNAPKGPISPSR